VEDLFTRCGQTFRTYRNTLVVLAIDQGHWASLRGRVKRILALRSIRDDKALMRQLSDENRKMVESKLRDSEDGLLFDLVSAYRYLAKAGEEGVTWLDIGVPIIGERGSLARRVHQYLQRGEYLAQAIAPQRLLSKTMREDEEEKPVDEIVDAFRRYPHLPMVEKEEVVWQAIARGVQEGIFSVRAGERTYFRESVPLSVLEGAVLVRRVEVPAPPEGAPLPGPMPAAAEAPGVGVERPAEPLSGAAPAGPQTYTLRARVPWEKFSDLMRGVIMPLQSESEELTAEIHLRARSHAGGFRKTTLDQKVRETLRQINAQVYEDTVAVVGADIPSAPDGRL
jgi:hypothetical protein